MAACPLLRFLQSENRKLNREYCSETFIRVVSNYPMPEKLSGVQRAACPLLRFLQSENRKLNREYCPETFIRVVSNYPMPEKLSGVLKPLPINRPFFSGGDGNLQTVLWRRQLAGCKRAERAGRVIRFVKINNGMTILIGKWYNHITPRMIGFGAVCFITKHDKQAR